MPSAWMLTASNVNDDPRSMPHLILWTRDERTSVRPIHEMLAKSSSQTELVQTEPKFHLTVSFADRGERFPLSYRLGASVAIECGI